ncbi:MAG: TonB-dependent receptor [Lewinellaceae bacterium]|nr:TonB-dependent receptor [Lewinellaceae bacterium]
MGQPDTINLPEVAVTASRLRGWQPGQEQSITDSLKLSFLKTENLSEALRSQAGVYVRDYGAGNISTAAVRGTSAGHTAVLWNGVPIRDPMLGLADLSILPLFFFDDVRLALGGGSSLWGSGALGGVIHLGSRLEEQKGFEVDYQAGAGSFGSRGQGLKLGYGKNGFTSSTRLFFRSADNDYLYKDLSGTEKRLPNAHARQMGLMQENSVELPGNHRLGIHLWAHRADRGIPPSRVQPSGRAHQEDEFLRGILDWQWAGARSSWITRVAASQNRLLYSDSLTNTFSDSRTRSLLAEAEGTHSLLPGLDAKAGVQFNYLDASSDVYSGFPRQDRWAAFAALRWESTGGRWQAVASGRQEWANGRAVPFTPSLSLHWRNRTGLQAGFAASRNYRLPTFNDLYWPNAGNPGLRPEQGWNQSLFIEADKDWNRWEALFRLSAFNYNVQDWIIWLPEGGLFRPENVRRVWSRGGAARLRLERELGSGAVGLEAGYSFTRSTNERSKDPGDPSVGKQLIYVPLHQGSGSLSWRSGSWYIAYRQEWAGRTYTLSDNSDWLPGFAVGALHLSREWRWKAFSGRLYARLENLWNKDYELVANRPLPGRHYQIGLNIHFSKK